MAEFAPRKMVGGVVKKIGARSPLAGVADCANGYFEAKSGVEKAQARVDEGDEGARAELQAHLLRQGRSARDMSRLEMRLRWPHSEKAMEAYEIHSDLVRQAPSVETLRERAASTLNLAVSGLRLAAVARRDGSEVDGEPITTLVHQAEADFANGKKMPWEIDQYAINSARRVAMAESLVGETRRGVRMAARAMGLAFLSESPRLATSNPELSRGQRFHAKTRAFIGGVAALGVSMLASREDEAAQNLAWRIAEKTL